MNRLPLLALFVVACTRPEPHPEIHADWPVDARPVTAHHWCMCGDCGCRCFGADGGIVSDYEPGCEDNSTYTQDLLQLQTDYQVDIESITHPADTGVRGSSDGGAP